MGDYSATPVVIAECMELNTFASGYNITREFLFLVPLPGYKQIPPYVSSLIRRR